MRRRRRRRRDSVRCALKKEVVDIDEVAHTDRTLLQLRREIERPHANVSNTELLERTDKEKPLEENLGCGYCNLLLIEQYARLVDQLAAICSKVVFDVMRNAILS